MSTRDIKLPKPSVVGVTDGHTRWITVKNQDYFTREQVIAAIEADRQSRGEPVAWGAFYFGGKRNGKLYSHTETEAQIDAYIADVHRSNDSITLRKGPLYTAPQPAEPVKEIELRTEDLHISTYSPTHRPQWAAHNDRGVRIVHLPTGTVAESHEERSPHRNQKIALDRLRQAIAAEPVKVPSDASLAAIGREHFGNPIPKEWYMAARALLARYGKPKTGAAGYTTGPVSNGGMDPRNTPTDHEKA